MLRHFEDNDCMEEKKKRISIPAIIGYVFLALLAVLGITLFCVSKWAFSTWEVLTLDEIIFHLTQSIDGTNPQVIKTLIKDYVSYGVAGGLLLTATAIVWRRKRIKLINVLATLAVVITSFSFIGYVIWDADSQLGVISYVYSEITGTDDDFIADHYVNPADVNVQFPKKKRNLVYIFLESMETTFSDTENGGAFEGMNCIPDLTEMAYENECFNGGKNSLNGGIALPGNTWTMGAMFGQTSGLPLKVPIHGNKMSAQDGSFFNSSVTLGDMLKKEGYKQELMIGSKVEFGGRDLYFSIHGDYGFKDFNWAVEQGKIPETYERFWGFEDEKLFDYAKEELTELGKGSEPFNFTILTVDTHFEDGDPDLQCENKFGDNRYADVIYDSNKRVKEFIDWLKQQDFYENTTVILCGDHPTMDKDFCMDVSKDYQRKTYTCIMNSAAENPQPDKYRTYSTVDMFPTTLAALGCKIDGEKLGLGTNLYSKVPTLVEDVGVNATKVGMNKSSKLMNELSDISISRKTLKKIRKQTFVTATPNKKGTLSIKVARIHKQLKIEYYKSIYVILTDTDPVTGEKKEYRIEMNLKPYQNNPNRFTAKATSDIPADRKPYLTGNAYVLVDGFDEPYMIGPFVQDGEAYLAELAKQHEEEAAKKAAEEAAAQGQAPAA